MRNLIQVRRFQFCFKLLRRVLPSEICMNIMSINLYPTKYFIFYWWVVGYLSNFHLTSPFPLSAPPTDTTPALQSLPTLGGGGRVGSALNVPVATYRESLTTIAVETIKAWLSINRCGCYKLFWKKGDRFRK